MSNKHDDQAAANSKDYIAIAKSNEEWQQVEASFNLEGITMTEENAALAGRLIAGEVNLEDALAELRRRHGSDGTAKLEVINH